MRPQPSQQNAGEATIVDPYFVIPETCDSTCRGLRRVAEEALLKARTYPGMQEIVIGTRHRRIGRCTFNVYVDGPGVIVGRGTVDTIMQRAYDNGAVRKEWVELFPPRW